MHPRYSFPCSTPRSHRHQSIRLLFFAITTPAIDDPHKVVKVIASEGKSGDQLDLTYTNCKVVGNGSFGVVFQAKLVGAPKDGEDIAIKKVLQDKRFKVRLHAIPCPLLLNPTESGTPNNETRLPSKRC